jgi:hypothetical protein
MLTITKAEVFSCTCDKCGYRWQSFMRPKRCAATKCKTTAWNKNSPAHNNDTVREDPLANLRETPPVIEEQGGDPDGEWSEVDRTAARKNSHQLGCDCLYCDRIREMFKEKKPAAAPAEKKTPPKKRKR